MYITSKQVTGGSARGVLAYYEPIAAVHRVHHCTQQHCHIVALFVFELFELCILQFTGTCISSYVMNIEYLNRSIS